MRVGGVDRSPWRDEGRALRREAGGLVHTESVRGRRAPLLTDAPLGALPPLAVAMNLEHLEGAEAGRVPVGVHVGCVREERPRVRRDASVGGGDAGLAVVHARLCRAQRRGGLAVSEPTLDPPFNDRVALVRLDVAVVIVAAAPKAMEEGRVLLEVLRLTDVAVRQSTLTVRGDVRYITIDCQPAVR